jgi:hypothetical protein
MPLFGAFKNISQTASLGETHFSLIACLHVCLYFLPLFTRKIGSAERERRKNLVVNSFVSIDDVKAFFEEIEKEKKKRVLSYSSAA